jgi:hypothetical protein
VHAKSASFIDRPCRCGATPLWSPCARRHLLQNDTLLQKTHTAAVHLWSAVQRLLFPLSLPALAARFPACPKTAWVLVGRTLRQRARLSRSVFLVTSEVFLPGVRTFESCFCQLALTKTKLLVSKPARFQLLRAARTENKVPTQPKLTCCARQECKLQ